LLSPYNKGEVAKAQLKAYEKGLNLDIDKLIPKIYDEHDYFRKMAKYHLSEVSTLTGSFLRQGHNFVDKSVLKFSTSTH
jgi:hypothetical protein